MAKANVSFGAINLGMPTGESASAGEVRPSEPFRLLILGDFSGRASRGIRQPLAGRKPLPVDRDKFDELFRKLDVQVRLPVAGDSGLPLVIRFEELDDFRPERLHARVEAFDKLRSTRKKLEDPRTFAEASASLQALVAKESPPAPPTPPQPAEVEGGSLLDSVLAATEQRKQTDDINMPGAGDWQSFLNKAVARSLVPGTSPLQRELLDHVDATTSVLLRAILHHPSFQGVEAAWRGLYFLLRRLDTDGAIKLFILDVSKDELAADLTLTDDLAKSGAYRLLVEQTVGTPGAPRWAMTTGLYSFGPNPDDVNILVRMSLLARLATAPFVAAGSGDVVGCTNPADRPDPDDWREPSGDAAQLWQALRAMPEAHCLGLVWPRFLLRLPYGRATDPAEGLDFEERPEHEQLLWGNAALLCACLLGQSFERDGWALQPGKVQDVTDLPLYVREVDGEAVAQPCAEALLGIRALARIQDAGLMPLASIGGSDGVRLMRFASIADPPRPLALRSSQD